MRISDWSSDVCSSDLAVRDHRGLIKDEDPVAQCGSRLVHQARIDRMLQQRCPALEQARQSHRANTSVALQHLHQSVLDGEPDDLLAILADDLRHGLYNTDLSRTGDTLDGHCPDGSAVAQAGWNGTGVFREKCWT